MEGVKVMAWILVWWLALFIPRTMVWTLEVGVVAGAHFHPLNKVTVYSSSIPLNFQAAWPRNLPDNSVVIKHTLTCKGGRATEFCTVQKEIKNYLMLVESLSNSLNQAAGEDLVIEESLVRQKRGITFLGELANWCCDIATSGQVSVLFRNEQELAQHMVEINKQILGNHEDLANLSNQVLVINEAVSEVFDKIQIKFKNLTNFLADVRDSIDKNFSEMWQEISYLQQIQLFMGTQLTKQTHTLFRIEILDQCRSGKLPSVLVSPAKLKTELERLVKVIDKDGFRLAISEKVVHVYYHLPICTCQIFDQQLMVQVKIPIVRKEADWKLYDFVAVPFKWKNTICVLHHETTFLAVNGEQITAVRGRALQDCRPFQDHLCFIPRHSGDAMLGALCPKAVFKGATAEHLGEVCAFSCQSGIQLIITQVGPERYFLTNAIGKLELICSISQNETRMLGEVSHPGALDVAVPCDCRLYLNNELRINEMYPCDADSKTKFEIIHVIPAAWSKVKKLHFSSHVSSKQTVFPSLDDCLANDWPLSIPHLNISLSTNGKVASSLVLEAPTGYQNFWIRNLQSISLGIIILSLLVIILRNPYLLGFGSFPRVNAEDLDTVIALEIGSTTIIVVLTIVFVCCLIMRFFRAKRRNKQTAETSDVGREIPSSSVVSQLEARLQQSDRIPASIRDSGGKKLRIWLTVNTTEA